MLRPNPGARICFATTAHEAHFFDDTRAVPRSRSDEWVVRVSDIDRGRRLPGEGRPGKADLLARVLT